MIKSLNTYMLSTQTNHENLLPMPLNFSIFKWFRFATSPNTKEVVSNHGMEIYSHVHIFEISFFGCISKLSKYKIHKNYIMVIHISLLIIDVG